DADRARDEHDHLRDLPPVLRCLPAGRLLGGHRRRPVLHAVPHHGGPAALRRAEGALPVTDRTVVSPAPATGGIAPRPRPRRTSDWAKAFALRNLADTILAGYLPFLVALLVIVLPLAWMIVSSFKPPGEIVTLTPSLLPQEPTLDNYGAVGTRVPLLTVLRNSLVVTAVGAAIKVLLAVTTAYALVFIRVPGRNLIFLGILVALMVPPEVSMLPNY